MNEDLKIIKKYFGENMMQLTRKLFSTILEEKNVLPSILLNNFSPEKNLYYDLISNNLINDFENYIYNIFNNYTCSLNDTKKKPHELLKEAGYTLYHCHSDVEIKEFKKYYEPMELLCTFKGNRLNKAHVFFAVKDNVDEIKREDFPFPERQDEYGTSVISIQFSRDDNHKLIITNRYNHVVNNADATFSNNLDNIINGLTSSFANTYGLVQSKVEVNFDIPGYVRANDNKLYKYNYRIGDIYYCPNNIIIDNYKVTQLPKEKYLLMDYFIINLEKDKEPKVVLYDNKIIDSFPDTFKNIKKIEITNNKDKYSKYIKFIDNNSNDIDIEVSNNNKIISYSNSNIFEINNNFLYHNRSLSDINIKNITSIGDNFLFNNRCLNEFIAPNLVEVGNYFIQENKVIDYIYLPNVVSIGNSFLYRNINLKRINLPNVKKIRDVFLLYNKDLKKFKALKLESIGNGFLMLNTELSEFNAPSIKKINNSFLTYNKKLNSFVANELTDVGKDFLKYNSSLNNVEMPNINNVGDNFMGTMNKSNNDMKLNNKHKLSKILKKIKLLRV